MNNKIISFLKLCTTPIWPANGTTLFYKMVPGDSTERTSVLKSVPAFLKFQNEQSFCHSNTMKVFPREMKTEPTMNKELVSIQEWPTIVWLSQGTKETYNGSCNCIFVTQGPISQ